MYVPSNQDRFLTFWSWSFLRLAGRVVVVSCIWSTVASIPLASRAVIRDRFNHEKAGSRDRRPNFATAAFGEIEKLLASCDHIFRRVFLRRDKQLGARGVAGVLAARVARRKASGRWSCCRGGCDQELSQLRGVRHGNVGQRRDTSGAHRDVL